MAKMCLKARESGKLEEIIRTQGDTIAGDRNEIGQPQGIAPAIARMYL